MKWPEVLQRINGGEDRVTEFKRELARDLSGVGKALCAFANSDGGLIVLGVSDAGAIVGLRDEPEAIHERLTGFLQNGCSEPVSAIYGRHKVSDGWVHWLEVGRSRGPEPLRYRRTYYVRRERSSVEPSPRERQELFNNFGFVLTEGQVVRSADIGDIDVGAFRRFQRARGIDVETGPQPDIEADLRNARVLGAADGELHPTLYGLMVFGRAPQDHPYTGSFYIQCAAYRGEDRGTEPLHAGRGGGRLEDRVQGALGWLDNLGWREQYDGIHRRDIPLVPRDVIREALVNAVTHRDYSYTGAKIMLEAFADRIDIASPGALPNRMTAEEVINGSLPRSRNEWMANAMLVARLMEQRGRGWPVMRRGMRAFNGTEPELVNNDTGGKFVRVTLRLNPNGERIE